MNLDLFNQIIESIPPLKAMGIKVTQVTENSVISVMPHEINKNHLGTIYAGSLFSLSEYTGVPPIVCKLGWNDYLYIMKEMSIRYYKPALTEVIVEAKFTDEDAQYCLKNIEENGKVDFTIETEIKNTEGEVVATTKNTYHLRKKQSAS